MKEIHVTQRVPVAKAPAVSRKSSHKPISLCSLLAAILTMSMALVGCGGTSNVQRENQPEQQTTASSQSSTSTSQPAAQSQSASSKPQAEFKTVAFTSEQQFAKYNFLIIRVATTDGVPSKVQLLYADPKTTGNSMKITKQVFTVCKITDAKDGSFTSTFGTNGSDGKLDGTIDGDKITGTLALTGAEPFAYTASATSDVTTCSQCGGTGTKTDYGGGRTQSVPCDKCGGKGFLAKYHGFSL